MIHRETFESDYNQFWSLTPAERTTVDASLVALIFVMLAMGTQFVELPSLEEKVQTAEFYGMSSVSFSGRALVTFCSIGFTSSVAFVFLSWATIDALYPDNGAHYLFLNER